MTILSHLYVLLKMVLDKFISILMYKNKVATARNLCTLLVM